MLNARNVEMRAWERGLAVFGDFQTMYPGHLKVYWEWLLMHSV